MKNYWHSAWSRRYSPFMASAFLLIFQKKTSPWVTPCPHRRFVPEGKLFTYHMYASEWNRLVQSYCRWVLRQDMRWYARVYEENFRNYFRAFSGIARRPFKKCTNAQLASTVQRVHDMLVSFGEQQMASFLPIDGIGKEIEAELARFDFGAALLRVMATTPKETKIAKARSALLELASKKSNSRALQTYAKTYAWLPVYEIIDRPWTADDFAEQLALIKNSRAELRRYRVERFKNLKEYRNLLGKVQDERLKKNIEVMHAFSYLKEMRDDYRRRAYYRLQPLFREIARRISISFEETGYLLVEEIVSALEGRPRVSRLEIQARKRCYALILRKGAVMIASGRAAEKFRVRHEGDNRTIGGSPAYGGVVRGTVRIIFHQGEFSKFHSGEILVTRMTHPEFASIMKQAKAILTDEGGITCHAAITAREMKKPCIIGTKIATKVLQDGDFVEVDANTGIVRKLS